jgi:hypothetical protein
MGKVADAIAARVQSISGGGDESVGEAASEEVSTSEAPGGEETAVEAAPTAAKAAPAVEAPVEVDEVALKKSILQEKLEAARERRRASREDRERRQHEGRTRQQIDSELAAAREERQKWEGLKVGNFREGLKAIGRDPLKTFEELEREAAEANTPEGKIRMLEEKFAARLEEADRKITALLEERENAKRSTEERETAARFEAHFTREVQDPEYKILRVAYDDDELLAYANGYRQNPESFFRAAEKVGVRLTAPQRGFTMREILSVLKAAQEAYDGRRKQREAKLSEESSDRNSRPQVNGTSAPEAVSTIGSELASTRASGERRKLSRQERIDQEIDRLDRRR